ncbi:MAG: phosphatidylglycerophosphatase A [Pseudomonadota bacterium]
MKRALATFGFVGLLRPAPGSWGSAAAIPFAWLLHGLGGFPLLLFATGVVFAVGVWAIAGLVADVEDPDRSEFVIDEVVGQWIALWPLSAGLWAAGATPWLFPWPGWVGAFLMFRLFDIWKPGPIGRLDAMKSPLGVMLDDVAAGMAAAVIVALAAALAHGVLMQ